MSFCPAVRALATDGRLVVSRRLPWLWAAAFLVAGAALLLVGPLEARAAEAKGPPQRIGILRVDFRGSIPAEIRRLFQQRIVEGLTAAAFQAFPVVSDEASACDEPGCLSEAAHRLRVDFLVTGAIEEHAKTYSVVLHLIEGRKGQRIGTHHDTCETCGAEEAAEKMGLAAATLRGRLASLGDQPSRFVVRSTPAGASLALDGKPVGRTPFDLELKAGEHVLRVSSQGYRPIEKTVSVVAGVDESVSLDLVAPQSRYPLDVMGYAAAAAGALTLTAGVWLLHINERPIGCDERVDVNGRCPTERNTATPAAILIGMGSALGVLGGTWIFLGRSHGADEGASPSPGEAARGQATENTAPGSNVYLVGVGGRL